MSVTTVAGRHAVSITPGSSVFRDAVAAELIKVRTLRSTVGFLAAGVIAMLAGGLILFLLVQSYDMATVTDQANYETADPTVVTMPFVTFFIGAIGAMVMTSEFRSGSVGPTLLAVPQRGVLLGAKATVTALVGSVGGLVFALMAFADARLMLGDRPAPLNPWPDWADGVPTVLSAALIVLVTALVGLGLGAMMRSTAAAVTTLGGLVLVSPIFAHFLPTVWQLRFGSILLPNLTPQIAGGDHPWLLSQGGAVAVAAAYVVIALGAGAISFSRRDAS